MSELNSDPPLSILSSPSIHSLSVSFASSFLPILHPFLPSPFTLHLSPFFLPFIHSIDPSRFKIYIGEPQKCLDAHYADPLVTHSVRLYTQLHPGYVTDFPSHSPSINLPLSHSLSSPLLVLSPSFSSTSFSRY